MKLLVLETVNNVDVGICQVKLEVKPSIYDNQINPVSFTLSFSVYWSELIAQLLTTPESIVSVSIDSLTSNLYTYSFDEISSSTTNSTLIEENQKKLNFYLKYDNQLNIKADSKLTLNFSLTDALLQNTDGYTLTATSLWVKLNGFYTCNEQEYYDLDETTCKSQSLGDIDVYLSLTDQPNQIHIQLSGNDVSEHMEQNFEKYIDDIIIEDIELEKYTWTLIQESDDEFILEFDFYTSIVGRKLLTINFQAPAGAPMSQQALIIESSQITLDEYYKLSQYDQEKMDSQKQLTSTSVILTQVAVPFAMIGIGQILFSLAFFLNIISLIKFVDIQYPIQVRNVVFNEINVFPNIKMLGGQIFPETLSDTQNLPDTFKRYDYSIYFINNTLEQIFQFFLLIIFGLFISFIHERYIKNINTKDASKPKKYSKKIWLFFYYFLINNYIIIIFTLQYLRYVVVFWLNCLYAPFQTVFGYINFLFGIIFGVLLILFLFWLYLIQKIFSRLCRDYKPVAVQSRFAKERVKAKAPQLTDKERIPQASPSSKARKSTQINTEKSVLNRQIKQGFINKLLVKLQPITPEAKKSFINKYMIASQGIKNEKNKKGFVLYQFYRLVILAFIIVALQKMALYSLVGCFVIIVIYFITLLCKKPFISQLLFVLTIFIEFIIILIYGLATYLAYLDDKEEFDNVSTRIKIGNMIAGLFLGTLLFSFLYIIILIYIYFKNKYLNIDRAKNQFQKDYNKYNMCIHCQAKGTHYCYECQNYFCREHCHFTHKYLLKENIEHNIFPHIDIRDPLRNTNKKKTNMINKFKKKEVQSLEDKKEKKNDALLDVTADKTLLGEDILEKLKKNFQAKQEQSEKILQDLDKDKTENLIVIPEEEKDQSKRHKKKKRHHHRRHKRRYDSDSDSNSEMSDNSSFSQTESSDSYQPRKHKHRHHRKQSFNLMQLPQQQQQKEVIFDMNQQRQQPTNRTFNNLNQFPNQKPISQVQDDFNFFQEFEEGQKPQPYIAPKQQIQPIQFQNDNLNQDRQGNQQYAIQMPGAQHQYTDADEPEPEDKF